MTGHRAIVTAGSDQKGRRPGFVDDDAVGGPLNRIDRHAFDDFRSRAAEKKLVELAPDDAVADGCVVRRPCLPTAQSPNIETVEILERVRLPVLLRIDLEHREDQRRDPSRTELDSGKTGLVDDQYVPTHPYQTLSTSRARRASAHDDDVVGFHHNLARDPARQDLIDASPESTPADPVSPAKRPPRF